jgi:hypothetical protein
VRKDAEHCKEPSREREGDSIRYENEGPKGNETRKQKLGQGAPNELESRRNPHGGRKGRCGIKELEDYLRVEWFFSSLARLNITTDCSQI